MKYQIREEEPETGRETDTVEKSVDRSINPRWFNEWLMHLENNEINKANAILDKHLEELETEPFFNDTDN